MLKHVIRRAGRKTAFTGRLRMTRVQAGHFDQRIPQRFRYRQQ